MSKCRIFGREKNNPSSILLEDGHQSQISLLRPENGYVSDTQQVVHQLSSLSLWFEEPFQDCWEDIRYSFLFCSEVFAQKIEEPGLFYESQVLR